MLVAKLNNGATVLAVPRGKYMGSPLTYSNRTQAERAAAKVRQDHGIAADVATFMGRPFYVVIAMPVRPLTGRPVLP